MRTFLKESSFLIFTFFRKAFPEEAKKKQEKKKGQVSDETLDLMRAIKARRTEKAAEEKIKEEKEWSLVSIPLKETTKHRIYLIG